MAPYENKRILVLATLVQRHSEFSQGTKETFARAPRDRAPLAPCHGAANDAVIELATRRTLAEAVAGLTIQLRFRPDETPDVRVAGVPSAGAAADEAWSLPQADVARGAADDVAALTIQPERPLINYTLIRPLDSFGHAVNFADRSAENEKYIEHRAQKNPDFELNRREADISLQASPAVDSVHTQTWYRPVNMATQKKLHFTSKPGIM